jgi:hypothetical protein
VDSEYVANGETLEVGELIVGDSQYGRKDFGDDLVREGAVV